MICTRSKLTAVFAALLMAAGLVVPWIHRQAVTADHADCEVHAEAGRHPDVPSGHDHDETRCGICLFTVQHLDSPEGLSVPAFEFTGICIAPCEPSASPDRQVPRILSARAPPLYS